MAGSLGEAGRGGYRGRGASILERSRRLSHVESLRTFVRVHELGSKSDAARDRRVSPAVASARIQQLEAHPAARLSQRTTRQLSPTEGAAGAAPAPAPRLPA